jgi:hypothetical protein
MISVFEDKLHAFFVSPIGNDFNAGSRSAPLLTIGAAITKAVSEALGADIYVQENGAVGYDEQVTLATNVSVYGGYCRGWLRNRTACVTRIRPSTSSGGLFGDFGVFGDNGIYNVTLDGFTIQTPSGREGISESTYGILMDSPSTVVISNNVIISGAGGSGAAGANGGAYPNAKDGIAGSGSTGGQGGVGEYSGGLAGNGGVSFTAGTGGSAGQGVTAGLGGAGGTVGAAGIAGGNGGDGAPGTSSPGGANFGFVGAYYAPATAFPGLSGQPGSGGGGGGGGGGSLSIFTSGTGGGGGGGGGGGFEGAPGGGGRGGGASFGIFIDHPNLVIVSGNSITTGDGGAGGFGGSGSRSNLGGLGGAGAAGIGAGASGGPGGRGGSGGSGGSGGGGGGGPTIGILEVGGTPLIKSSNSITIGVGGAGGGATSPATPGATGRAVAELRM